MKQIIALGNAAKNIAHYFDTYEVYEIFSITSEPDSSFQIPSFKEYEQYEREDYPLPNFNIFKEDEVTFLVCGASKEAAASLKILQTLQFCEVSVVYVRPELGTLSKEKRMLERVAFHVLQEYARSGKLKSVTLIDNSVIENFEEFKGNLPIIGYYKKINELIVSTLHMINVFHNSKPIINNLQNPKHISSIKTVGVVNVETGEERMFFPLKELTDRRYYYAIGRKRLESEGGLYALIKEQVRSRGGEPNFGVYDTNYETDYCYSQHYTSFIQSK